tara:strand:- start:699 stop:1703 length:1005 start_codon:yes stop_codon:yes gene_type:complete
MAVFNLSRREFVYSTLLISLLGLTGCLNKSKKFVISAVNKSLPEEWLQNLPPDWIFKNLETNSGIYPYTMPFEEQIDLFAIEDGWIQDLQDQELQIMKVDNLRPNLNKHSRDFLMSLSSNLKIKLFPIALTPWVMLFRNGEPWIKKARKSWEVLLEPDMKGQVLLPNSSRMLISLVDKMGTSDELKRLRQQAISFDDRNALNWINSGKARVAVLPLQRCVPSLLRDPRLSVVLPEEGSPLNWTLLARPLSSRAFLPHDWVKRSWETPFLSKLLAQGWFPPLDYYKLSKGVSVFPKKFQVTLLPSEQAWNNCWSLPPLNSDERQDLENRWIKSIP